MYFVHPQIKFNLENLKKVFFSFFKSSDKNELEKVKLMFPKKEIIFTDMGRTAFKLIIEELQLQNSQILFPAYICDIFFPIFKKYNLSPIFLDINKKTFNIKFEEIEKKITPKVKAILVCHTYGLPIDIEKIKAIYGDYNPPTTLPAKGWAPRFSVIEDCAHSFGAKYDGIYTGNFGDAAFFSLYKQFPCLRGGMAIFGKQKLGIRKKELSKTHFGLRDFISLLNCFSFFAFLFKKFGGEIAPKIQRKEKSEEISRINNVSLKLFLNFVENFEENLKKRVNLALFFQKELRKLGFEVQESKNNVFCYLSTLVPRSINRDEFVKELRKHKIFCTRIWRDPIILNRDVQKEYNINPNEFPNTVEVAKRIVNFPLQNYYTEKDIEKIVEKVKATF